MSAGLVANSPPARLWFAGPLLSIELPGGIRLVDRTNNGLEGFNHALKHGERRRSGRKVVTQDFEKLPPAAALARNLTALVCYLTRQPSAAAALAGAMGGALFEGLIVAEALKAYAQRGIRPALYFWRTHDGFEVDLIISANGKLIPVEIKPTATPTLRHADPLRKFAAMAGPEAAPGLLVCRLQQETRLSDGHRAIPWQEFPAWLENQIGEASGETAPPQPPELARLRKHLNERTLLRARREDRS